jgi:hypothetical protein
VLSLLLGDPRPSGPCVSCGREIAAPADLSFVDRLLWTLGHPDGDSAIVAAKTLGNGHVVAALPALRRVVDQRSDPFLAAHALRRAIQIAGAEQLRGWLSELAHCESFLLRDAASCALARADHQPGAGTA